MDRYGWINIYSVMHFYVFAASYTCSSDMSCNSSEKDEAYLYIGIMSRCDFVQSSCSFFSVYIL